ncbi:hypothetical protein MNBD_GAMMA08-996 [hydrothermal vent metagenome]|uniref:PEP-CTERM protein-sorting domain-containing protein n=1 Tax=hydrothermal vent metagenome TaxID=652676 RepID=A0A3B0X8P8_9ZZZZ
MNFKRTTLSSVLVLSFMSAAQAGLITPSLTANVAIGDNPSTIFDFSEFGESISNGKGTTTFVGSSSNLAYDFSWDISANADPFITGNLTFTNTTSAVQVFNIDLLLPTVSTAGPVQETGEIGLTLTDTGQSGSADLTLIQWYGLIDPIPGPSILDMSLLTGSVNCGGVGGVGSVGCIAALSPVSGTQLHGDADHNTNPITSIGTRISFTLSAFDTVSINTKWDVVPVAPVPVPAAVWLFVSGFAGLMGAAKIRRNKAG